MSTDSSTGPDKGSSMGQVDILEGLAPGAQECFLAHCKSRCVPARAALFRQAEQHDANFLIQSGLIRTYYLAPSGREITLAYWGRGDLVGGPDFLGSGYHVWSARTVEPTSVLIIEGAQLRQLCYEIPQLGELVNRALAFKLRWVSSLLQLLGTQSVPNRLGRLLALLGDAYGTPADQGMAIPRHFTQSDLAAMVGASRQWVSATLKRLERDGFVVRDNRRQIVVRDPERLKEFAEGA